MLNLQTLKSHLNSECTVIFQEISAFCGSNIQAASLLSKLIYWTEKVEQDHQRHGWIYKTASDLKHELGLTRRGYEKARHFLVSLGVLQYRRGGVHGKMHWRINLGQLLEHIYTKVKKIPLPKDMLNTQIDIHNREIPSWVPLKLWNDYLHVYKKRTGKFPSTRQKNKLIEQLKKLSAQFDVALVMQRSITNAWIGFYSLEYQIVQTVSTNHHLKAAPQLVENPALTQSGIRQRTQDSDAARNLFFSNLKNIFKK